MNHGGRSQASGSGAAGFTLIENMIALAVFAIGMMGIVYMMLNGVGLSRTSQSLTQAYVAAQEIIGMMRAAGPGIYQYNNVNTKNGAPSASTVAGQNISTWMQSLQYLPGSGAIHGGYGQITITPEAGVSVGLCPCNAQVTITWDGGRKSYVVETVVGY